MGKKNIEENIWILKGKRMCRIRYNSELELQYNFANITSEINRRLEWLGHVNRIKDDRIPKRALNLKSECHRKPRYDDVEDI